MQVIEQGGLSPSGADTALALGYFDGVHLGHAQVINAAGGYAKTHGLRLAVFTFIKDGADTAFKKRILPQWQKQAALQALGVEVCFTPLFSSFSRLSPRQFFCDSIINKYRAKALFCGENYGFGAQRAGDTQLLATLCKEFQLHLEVLPLAVWKGAPVSSSRIRGTLAMGDMEEAAAMLGRPYEICFLVQHGQGLGQELGFPTINQHFPADMQEPAPGVYITSTFLDGVWRPSATGYGNRPTVGGQNNSCETFIPGYQGNLYGKEVKIRFYQRMGEVQKFATQQQLAGAVQGWASQALHYFAEKDKA